MFWAFILFFALGSKAEAQASPPNDQKAVAHGSQASTQPTPKLLSAALPSSTEDSAAESELLRLANQSRRQAGVPPLRMNEDLIRAARSHARLMIEQRQLSHQFDGEPSLLKRLHGTGVPLNSVGENVAYNANAASWNIDIFNGGRQSINTGSTSGSSSSGSTTPPSSSGNP